MLGKSELEAIFKKDLLSYLDCTDKDSFMEQYRENFMYALGTGNTDIIESACRAALAAVQVHPDWKKK